MPPVPISHRGLTPGLTRGFPSCAPPWPLVPRLLRGPPSLRVPRALPTGLPRRPPSRPPPACSLPVYTSFPSLSASPWALVPAFTPVSPVPGSRVPRAGVPCRPPAKLPPCPHPALQHSSPVPRALRLHLPLGLPMVGRAGGGRTRAISHPMCSTMASYSRGRNARHSSSALKVRTVGVHGMWEAQVCKLPGRRLGWAGSPRRVMDGPNG